MIIVAIAQFVSLFIVVKELRSSREIKVLSVSDYIAKMVFAVVIQNCIDNDDVPIDFSTALYALNLYSYDGNERVWIQMRRNLRKAYNNILLSVISYYIMTTDL